MSVLHLAAPALPLHSAGKYVAAAYIVFVALILVYVAIMAKRLGRTERELEELKRQSHTQAHDATNDQAEREPEPVR